MHSRIVELYCEKMKIAIIGTFQVGKSTLLNCLINDSLAGVGIGTPTTHTLNFYKNNTSPEILCRNIKGECLYRQSWERGVSEFSIPRGTVRVMYELPKSFDLHGNILIDTPGLDSAGKEASWDTMRTIDIIRDNAVDLLILVVSNTQLDSAIRSSVLPCIKEARKNLIVLMNCNRRNHPDPSSKINQETALQIDEELRAAGIRHSRVSMSGESKVLPCNAVWWWLSQKKNHPCVFFNQQTDEVFQARYHDLKNYFSDILEQTIPDSETLLQKSNLFHLFTYLHDAGMRKFLWRKDNPPITTEKLKFELQKRLN